MAYRGGHEAHSNSTTSDILCVASQHPNKKKSARHQRWVTRFMNTATQKRSAQEVRPSSETRVPLEAIRKKGETQP